MNPISRAVGYRLTFVVLIALPMTLSHGQTLPEGWETRAPRDELRPDFDFLPSGGPNQKGSMVIEHDHREGLDGHFQKVVTIRGGTWYCFSALRSTRNVKSARRSALVRIVWKDAQGKLVSATLDSDRASTFAHPPSAEPEHPRDGATGLDGWTEVGGTYRAPEGAVTATIELHLQWAPLGRIEWSEVQFESCPEPPQRRIRLGSIHFRPTGTSPMENCRQYAPLIANAAKKKCDLVVLGETVPAVGVSMRPHETAEVIPGPMTNYFAGLARQHAVHVVVSLYERDAHLVYNTAVLIDDQGNLVGKYRKVCLPHAEVENGIAPGDEYPVFDTRLGKIGMMICYDGFFPDVARELTNGGAEVIAWPVWGCNPLLAQARACENHVYIVSSTYMQPKDGWMISAIFDPFGAPIAQADQWGTITFADVDLSRPYIGPYNLGDFGAMLPRHRPLSVPE